MQIFSDNKTNLMFMYLNKCAYTSLNTGCQQASNCKQAMTESYVPSASIIIIYRKMKVIIIQQNKITMTVNCFSKVHVLLFSSAKNINNTCR